jgi:hypothetical protein
MKKLILPFFTLITYASNAQFSIVPQVGVETFRTTLSSGDFSSFSPLGVQFAPRLAVRMAYNLKSGQGAFLGVATNSPGVVYKFTDPQNARSAYSASAGDYNVRLEGGYQYTSKPITLRKAANTKNTNSSAGRCGQKYEVAQKPGCSRYRAAGMCNSNRSSTSYAKLASPDRGMFMRIKPSVGLALAPSGSELETTTKGAMTTYKYTSGWNTALIAGTAFEFGTREQSKLVVSINYLRGLGNNSQTIVNNELIKSPTTTLSSKTSGFNISVGIPFSFSKKTTVVQTPQYKSSSQRGQCGRYRIYHM